MTENKELALQQEIENKFLNSINIDSYMNQPAVQERMNKTLENIFNNKTISENYQDLLIEIPMSQSNFLSQCVQFTEHWTPHRKLKQALIELKNKYGALNAAKNSYFQAINKRKKVQYQIDLINQIIIQLNENKELDLRVALKISTLNIGILSKPIIDIIERNGKVDDIEYVEIITEKMKDKASDLFIKLQEAEYAVKDSDHMVKDALDSAGMYESIIEQYRREVEESGLSYEEAEMVYYVMFLTWEAENQFRTGDHELDRGTSKVITQMPNGLRRKIYQNINFLRQKYFKEKRPSDSDFLIRENPDLFKPNKTGDMEFEGDKITNFLGIEPIKQLTRK